MAGDEFDAMFDDPLYTNIRDILGPLIGRRLVDITQHSKEEFRDDQTSYVMLMFDDGSYLRFTIGDAGFDHNVGED